MIGQRVTVLHEGKECDGKVVKVSSSHHCVVYWQIGKGRNIEKYNRLYSIEEVNRGEVVGGKLKI